MSIIMAVGNRHHLILASDGRVSDTDANGNHIVLDENFKKIFRLSRSVCVLIAGNRNQCMQIVHILQGNMLASTMPQLCMEAICDIFQNHMIAAANELNVRLIVAGINSLHERDLYLLSADQDGINKEKIWLNDAASYVAKGDIQEGETDYFFSILNENSRDMKTNMKLCIAEAAKRNKSVNDVVFFEEL